MLNAVVRAANTHTGPAMHTHTSTSRPLWVKRSRGGDLILVSCSFWLCAAHLNHWPKNHSWSTFFFRHFHELWQVCGNPQEPLCKTQRVWWREWEGRRVKEQGWAEVRRQNGWALRERRGVFVFWSNRETPDLPVKTFTPRRFTERQRGKEGERERERQSIKVTLILVQLNPKFY